MQKNNIKSELILSGISHIDKEICKSIGLIQKNSSEKDDDLARNDKNIWILKSDISPTIPFDDHLIELVKWLSSYEAVLSQLTRNFEVEISVYGFSNEATRQACHISVEVNRALARIGADLDIDVYPILEEQLDNDEKLKHLAIHLKNLHLANNLDTALNISKAIAAIEINCRQINDDLITNLMWPELEKEAVEERLRKIIRSIELINISRQTLIDTNIKESTSY